MNDSSVVRASPLRAFFALACVGALLGAASATASCNGVLGIESATEAPPVLTDPNAVATCGTYCSTVLANCTGQHYAQFIEVAQQIHICTLACANSSWDPGNPGETSGNSLACRATHAVMAKAEPEANCQAAGLGGGNICGNATSDICAGFCQLVTSYCGDQAYDADSADCEAKCPSYPYYTGADASDIDLGEGNSLNCRLYHLENAYLSPSQISTHCPHTTLDSIPCSNADAG